MISTNDLNTLPGATVYGSDREKIGRAGQAYVDDQSGEPEWITVNTGLFGTKDHVKDAPNVDPENGHLDEAEEQRLYSHYGLTGGNVAGGNTGDVLGDVSGVGVGGVGGDIDTTGSAAGTTEGHDTSGPTTDNAMTRSEEQLRVGTQSRESGRARLRKYVVTEQQNVTVPVTREEVSIE